MKLIERLRAMAAEMEEAEVFPCEVADCREAANTLEAWESVIRDWQTVMGSCKHCGAHINVINSPHEPHKSECPVPAALGKLDNG